jgi:MFS family permease
VDGLEAVDLVAAQRRVVAVLSAAQIAGGVGIGAAVSVGALLALDLSGSAGWSGLASTATTLGAAAVAVPLARLAVARGRRVALSTGWLVASAGAALAVVAASVRSFALLLVGLVLLGVGSASNLQARFAATDLAPPRIRARSLGLVVGATTVGAVAGPNLTRPGASLAGVVGVPPLAGPLLVCSVAAALAAAVLAVALRPDPLLTAGRALPIAPGSAPPGPTGGAAPVDVAAAVDPAGPAGAVDPVGPVHRRNALAVIAASPAAVAALASLVTGHGVMVAVMSMTPVHMNGQGDGLELIGLTISLHIAGMYAFSPLVGWLADRYGRIRAIAAGQVLLVVAALLTATAGMSTERIMAGLMLLGLGWSFSTVSASALLADAVPAADRPRVQGTADLFMNLAGASAGVAGGVVVAVAGYTVLSVLAAVSVAPAAAIVAGRLVAAHRAAGVEQVAAGPA